MRPTPYAAVTANPGSTLGSRAGARALVSVPNQRAVTHTQAFCGAVVAALRVWAEVTSDAALDDALRRLPEELEGTIGRARTWVDETGEIDAETAIVFGSGPAWAAALEAALLLKEVAGIPAEGVETREGATSAMMALRPGALALSLPAGADDPLLAEAEEICAGQGATVLRAPGGDCRPPARRGVDVPRGRRAQRAARARTRARRRPARLDGGVLQGRETHGMSLGLGVIGCGSVFAGPYRGMIERSARRRARARERRLRRRRREAPRSRGPLRRRPRARAGPTR